MFAVPGPTPVTTPVPEPTTETAVVLELQIPPAIVLAAVSEAPTHKSPIPDKGVGDDKTEILVEVKQPVDNL